MKIELITPVQDIKRSILYAIQGARFAMKSLSDSTYDIKYTDDTVIFGGGDRGLAYTLAHTPNASGHDKFLQQITFIVDINWARYCWQEFDTYRVGISKQSESTMHTFLTDFRKISLEDFDYDKDMQFRQPTDIYIEVYLKDFIHYVNQLYEIYENKEITKDQLRNLIKNALPESFMQKRRVSMNYANMKNIFMQRKNHKNYQWITFIEELYNCLPMSKLWAKDWNNK